MLVPCEIAVKSVVPSIRAFIAIELTQSYQMKQDDVANILGITQTAISKYTRQVRGTVIKLDSSEEIKTLIQQMARQILDQETSKHEIALKFCQICQIVRRNRLMCQICKRNDPKIDLQVCKICDSI